MPYYRNTMTGEIRRQCRLCGDMMCWAETSDGTRWHHCHGCDLRNCSEEAYQD